MQSYKEVEFDTQPRVKVFTIDEAVEATGIGRSGIQQMIDDPDAEFPFFKIGIKTMIPVIALENYFIEISKKRKQFGRAAGENK